MDREDKAQEARQMWDMPLGRRTRLMAERYGIRPRKRLGQSFLINGQAAERIADEVAKLEPPGVVEIGGGLGALSVPLLRRLPRVRLVVYEVDPVVCQGLADLLCPAARRCQVHCADFLEADPTEAGADERWVAVGNLPYAITTPILERLFTGRPRWRAAVVMVQKEFAQRMVSSPGGRVYGALSLFTRFHCESIETLMELSPGNFWPRPAVSSTVLRLMLRRDPRAVFREPEVFEAVVRGAFGYRRKKLAVALATAAPLGASAEQIDAALQAAGVDGNRRPETLSLEEFVAVAEALCRATARNV